jgi:hypothetical protein
VIYRNHFRKSIPLMQNKSGSYTGTKRRAASELEGEEIAVKLEI